MSWSLSAKKFYIIIFLCHTLCHHPGEISKRKRCNGNFTRDFPLCERNRNDHISSIAAFLIEIQLSADVEDGRDVIRRRWRLIIPVSASWPLAHFIKFKINKYALQRYEKMLRYVQNILGEYTSTSINDIKPFLSSSYFIVSVFQALLLKCNHLVNGWRGFYLLPLWKSNGRIVSKNENFSWYTISREKEYLLRKKKNCLRQQLREKLYGRRVPLNRGISSYRLRR